MEGGVGGALTYGHERFALLPACKLLWCPDFKGETLVGRGVGADLDRGSVAFIAEGIPVNFANGNRHWFADGWQRLLGAGKRRGRHRCCNWCGSDWWGERTAQWVAVGRRYDGAIGLRKREKWKRNIPTINGEPIVADPFPATLHSHIVGA